MEVFELWRLFYLKKAVEGTGDINSSYRGFRVIEFLLYAVYKSTYGLKVFI